MMRLAFFGFLASCWLPLLLCGQPLTRTTDKPYADGRSSAIYAVLPLIQGGFIVVGKSKPLLGSPSRSHPEISEGGGYDILLAPDAPAGVLPNFRNARTYGRSGDECAFAAAQTFDGGFVLAGYSDSRADDAKGNKDAYLLKLDEQGNYLWHYRDGGKRDDELRDVVQLDDGSICAVGTSDGQPYFVRVSAQGKTIATQQPRVRGNLGRFTALCPDPDGKNIVAVGSIGKGEKQVPFLYHLDPATGESTGEPGYFDGIQHNQYGAAVDVLLNQQNQIVLLCTAYSPEKLEDARLICLDAEGLPVFDKTYGGESEDTPAAFTQEYNGDYYITGRSLSWGRAARAPRLCVLVVNKNGEEQEDKRYYDDQNDSEGFCTAMLPGRRLLVGGTRKGDDWAAQFQLSAPDAPQQELDILPLRFMDGNDEGDGLLGPGERGYYLLKVENRGERVPDVRVKVPRQLGDGLQYPEFLYLGDMPEKSTRLVALPVKLSGKTTRDQAEDINLILCIKAVQTRVVRSITIPRK